jgi:cyclin B
VTVSTIDRYLSKVPIKKTQLHLLGVAALLISTKYEEIYPPELKDLLSVSENKFTKEEVLKLEFEILSTLEFNFFVPSLLRFI